MNKDLFVVGFVILLPALAFGLGGLAASSTYFRTKRVRLCAVAIGYLVLGFGVQIVLGWKYFRNEFGALLLLLLLLHGLFWGAALGFRRKGAVE